MKRGPPFHLISQCPNLVSRGHTCYQVLGYLSGNFDLYKSTYDCIAPRFKYTHTHTHTHTNAVHITLCLVFLPTVFPIVPLPLTICEINLLYNQWSGVLLAHFPP